MANPVASELLSLERQFWQAMKDRDAETAMRLTDDQCIVTGHQGVGSIDRRTLGAMVQTATYNIDAFELQPGAQVRMVGDDVAVVAYTVHEELTVEGEKIAFDAADASTWVRRNGTWVCALHTEAISGDPFGRDRH